MSAAMVMAHKTNVPLGFVIILFIFVSIVMGVEDDRTCPHNGVNFGGRCFWFFDVKLSWFEAEKLCHHLYGDHVTLVTIKDRETSEFIRNQSISALWIGLHEAHGETQWRWVDNTEPANGNYRNWQTGAPENRVGGPEKNCASMIFDSYFWRDEPCWNVHGFVCAELPSAPMCPNGGTFFRDRCYWRVSRYLTWAAANQACQDEFGPEVRLAVARDAEVNLFLSRLVNSHVWLGLSDIEEENVWKWVDGAPLEYSNWRRTQPDNHLGREDCVSLIHHASRSHDPATWYDTPCEPQRKAFICAIPPCYDMSGSGSDLEDDDSDIEITDANICTRTECTQHCVAGGACNATGQCMCVRQFSEMTCNLDERKVEIENEIVNATTGGSFTLKCKVNVPVDHISSLSWTKCEPGYLPEYRSTITNVFSQGYSTLLISDVGLEDAGIYHCKVVFRFTSGLSDVTIPVAGKASVNVTEVSTPLPTTTQTTKKTTTEMSSTKETSTPVPTTRRPTERLSTKEVQTSTPTTKSTTTERTTTKATTKAREESATAIVTDQTTPIDFGDQPIPPFELTEDRPNKQNYQEKEIHIKSGKVGKANKESLKYSTYQPARGATAVIVILLIMTTLLIATVVVLMMKMKKMERERLGDGMELQDTF